MERSTVRSDEPLDVILDVDTGVDDAMALALAVRSRRLHLLGVTTVAGNVAVDKTTDNTLRVLHYLGADDVPVARGASRPLARALKTAEAFHGADGLGGLTLPPSHRGPVDASAAEFLVSALRKARRPVTLVALGPQTNLALALLLAPDVVTEKVQRLVFMGGSVAALGNSTPSAEFNAWVDPEAMRLVLRSGLPITMVPLDVITSATLPAAEIASMKDAEDPALRLIAELSPIFVQFFGGEEVVFCDPSAVAVAIDPGLVETKPLAVDVETAGELTTGMTVVDRRLKAAEGVPLSRPNCDVATKLDRDRFRQVFRDTFTESRHRFSDPVRTNSPIR